MKPVLVTRLIPEIKKIRENNPDKLIALDLVSAVPATPVDLTLVDTAYFRFKSVWPSSGNGSLDRT